MADVGRPRNIKSPEQFWQLFLDYVADLKTKESDWLKIQYVGKEGERKEDSLKLPLTIEGFKRLVLQSLKNFFVCGFFVIPVFFGITPTFNIAPRAVIVKSINITT